MKNKDLPAIQEYAKEWKVSLMEASWRWLAMTEDYRNVFRKRAHDTQS